MLTSLFGLIFSIILPAYAGYNGLGLRYAFIYGAFCSIPMIWTTNAFRELRAKVAGRESNLTYWIFALPIGMVAVGGLVGITNSALYSLVAWLVGLPIRW